MAVECPAIAGTQPGCGKAHGQGYGVYDGNPCKNGGQCHDNFDLSPWNVAHGKYTCECIGAWAGDHCEIPAPSLLVRVH